MLDIFRDSILITDMVQLCNSTMATVYGPLQWMSRPKVYAGLLLKTLGSTKTDIWEIVKSDQKCWFAKLEARPLLHMMLPSALSGCQSGRSFLDSLTSTRKHFFFVITISFWRPGYSEAMHKARNRGHTTSKETNRHNSRLRHLAAAIQEPSRTSKPHHAPIPHVPHSNLEPRKNRSRKKRKNLTA